MRGVLLTAFALLGCARGWEANPSRHYHLKIDAGFTDEQKNAIVDAATEWETTSGDYVTFDVDATAKNDVVTFQPATGFTLEREFGGAIGESIYEGQSTLIMLAPEMDAQTFHQAATHEIGHAIGLVHTGPGTIMCQDATCAAQIVTCADIEQLERATLACP